MTITKRIFNNVFWLAVSEVSSRALIFLGTIYLARTLGKAGFGLYSLSLAIGIYFWAAVDMGVSGYGTREVAQNKNSAGDLYSNLNSLRFFLASGLFLVFCGILYFINIPYEKKLVFLAGAFYAVANSLSADWVLRGLEKMQYILHARTATSLFFLVCVYLTVKSSSDVINASVVYAISFLVGSITFMIILYQKFEMVFSLKVYFEQWIKHIKESIYFAINGVFNSISLFMPIIFMGLWNTHEEIGIFSAPHRLIVMLINMIGLLIWGLSPTLSNLYVTDKDSFRKVFDNFIKFIIALVVPVCIIAVFWSENIIKFLYGNSYADSKNIFNILIVFTFLSLVRYSYGNALISAGIHRLNMVATAVGATMVLLVSTILIPKYSSYGAAWALIGGEIFTLIIMVCLFVKKVYCSNYFMTYMVKVFFTGMVMGLTLMNIHFSMISTTFLGILIYGFLTFSLGVVNKKTIKQVFQMITDR